VFKVKAKRITKKKKIYCDWKQAKNSLKKTGRTNKDQEGTKRGEKKLTF
jgi:hypothetical protein